MIQELWRVPYSQITYSIFGMLEFLEQNPSNKTKRERE